MKKKAVVFGSFVVDLMGRASHLPVPGETVKGNYFKLGPGGKGFNQGVAAYKAGADIKMITKLGKDLFTQVAEDTMKELGMDQSYIFYSETEPTGIALISVEEDGSENQILVVPGACDHITQADIMSVADVIKESDYLLTQLETNIDAIETVVQLANENNVKVILNTAPIQEVSDDLLSKVYMVTPNEIEAEYLTGVRVTDLNTAKEAANNFKNRGVANVIITMGSKGVFVSTETEERFVPAFKVDAIDTTGAGDAFNGGFLAALINGKDIFKAAEYGNAVGALSVQKIGTTPSMPTLEEIEKFLVERK